MIRTVRRYGRVGFSRVFTPSLDRAELSILRSA
jgi:hypothetical protein